MTTRRKPNHAKTSEPPSVPVAHRRGRSLSSQTLGALPILNRLLQRIRLEEFLHAALPTHDARTKLSPVKALLVLLRNLLLSREPMYGIGEWAARHAPDQLGLAPDDIQCLNDDRVGRALDSLFAADVPSLVLAVVTHVVKEFGVRLHELHNDSTTVSVCGAYADASLPRRVLGRPTEENRRPRRNPGLLTRSATNPPPPPKGTGWCGITAAARPNRTRCAAVRRSNAH